MIGFILSFIYVLLLLATIPVYVYIGYKLNESRLRWGFMGFGALLFLPLVCMPVLYIGKPQFLLMFWPMIQFISPVFALAIAGFVAYKKRLLVKSLA
jgi:hypothetical protein